MALNSPFGNGPQNLANPVPAANAVAAAQPQINPGQVTMPPMEIQAGKEQPAPQGAPEPQGSSGPAIPDFNQLMAGSPTADQTSNSMPSSNEQKQPGPSKISDQFRIGDNGQYEQLDNGKWKKLSKDKSETLSRLDDLLAAHIPSLSVSPMPGQAGGVGGVLPQGSSSSVDDIIRGGTVQGGGALTAIGTKALAGAEEGMAGGLPGAVIGGISAAAGGAISGKVYDFVKGVLNIGDKKDRSAVVDGLSAMLGEVAGNAAVGYTQGKQIEAQTNKFFSDQGADARQNANQAGVSLPPEVAYPTPQNKAIASGIAQGQYGPSYQNQYAIRQAQMRDELNQRIDQVTEQIHPAIRASEPAKVDFQDAIEDKRDAVGSEIGKIKGLAQAKSAGGHDPITAIMENQTTYGISDLEKAFKQEINKYGNYFLSDGSPNPRFVGSDQTNSPQLSEVEMMSNATPEAKALYHLFTKIEDASQMNDRGGITLKELDSYQSEIGKKIGALPRGELRGNLQQIYASMLNKQSNIIAEQLEPTMPFMSDRLKNLNGDYKNIVDLSDRIDRIIQDDPSNASQALIMRNKPEVLRDLKSVLGEDTFNKLAAGYLKFLSDKSVSVGSKYYNPETIGNAFKVIPKESREILFGDKLPDIEALLKTGSLINKASMDVQTVQSSPLVMKFIKTAKGVSYLFGGDTSIIHDLLKGNKAAQEYITGELADRFSEYELNKRIESSSKWAGRVKVLNSVKVRSGAAGAMSLLTPSSKSSSQNDKKSKDLSFGELMGQ